MVQKTKLHSNMCSVDKILDNLYDHEYVINMITNDINLLTITSSNTMTIFETIFCDDKFDIYYYAGQRDLYKFIFDSIKKIDTDNLNKQLTHIINRFEIDIVFKKLQKRAVLLISNFDVKFSNTFINNIFKEMVHSLIHEKCLLTSNYNFLSKIVFMLEKYKNILVFDNGWIVFMNKIFEEIKYIEKNQDYCKSLYPAESIIINNFTKFMTIASVDYPQDVLDYCLFNSIILNNYEYAEHFLDLGANPDSIIVNGEDCRTLSQKYNLYNMLKLINKY